MIGRLQNILLDVWTLFEFDLKLIQRQFFVPYRLYQGDVTVLNVHARSSFLLTKIIKIIFSWKSILAVNCTFSRVFDFLVWLTAGSHCLILSGSCVALIERYSTELNLCLQGSSICVHTVKKVSHFPVPSQGKFGKWHPGWGRENGWPFLQCKVTHLPLAYPLEYKTSVVR